LGIAGKETIKKEQKDFEAEMATIGLQISRNLIKFYDETRIQSVTKELQTNLRQVQEEDKNLNTVIEKNLSFEDHIQRDSGNPFLEDIIKLAKLVPLQLLVLGRPKSGKTTLAKAIAKKYSLVYISIESMVDKIFECSKFFE
jgi:SpoVK/Ycf46/Vps4 family AAA+-type ATPase